MPKILEKYKEEICVNCKADCYIAKGIVVFADKSGLYAKCVDYKSNLKIKRGFLLPWGFNKNRRKDKCL